MEFVGMNNETSVCSLILRKRQAHIAEKYFYETAIFVTILTLSVLKTHTVI